MKVKSILSLALVASLLFLGNAAKLAASPPLTMRLLILATDQSDSGYLSISSYLKQLGTPYDVTFVDNLNPDGSGNRLSSLRLVDSTGNGLYQGIIQTNGSFTVCATTCQSLLSATDLAKLQNYEAQYKVRAVAYMTYPDAAWGLVPADSGAAYSQANPLNVTLTSAGATVFSYLNSTNAVPVGGFGDASIWGYRATTTAASNETTTPLLVSGNYTVAVSHTTADGRELMAFTVDNYPGLIHSTAFAYGLINWVTRGVFLGSRRVYLNTQIDDLLLGNRLYAPSLPQCPNDSSCPTLFATAQDLNALATWQSNMQADPQFQSFRATFAFNGVGTTWYSPSDPIFPAIAALNPKFRWLSHTWDHSNLDCFSQDAGGACVPATLAQSLSELTQNVNVAPSLGIAFDRTGMVTPFNGGLQNPNFMQAATQVGLQYIVTADDPPGPNLGMASSIAPSVFLIPRRGNNLFDDVSTPQTGAYGSWPDEYNAKFGPNGTTPLYNQNLTYPQIIDAESQIVFQNNMLTYEPYPLGYHIDNSSAYDGTHSMFSDLMDAAIAKYKKFFNLPVVTLDMGEIGSLLMNRAQYNASGAIAVYTPGVGVKLTAQNAAIIPITGACSQTSCSTYGGQLQDNVTVGANSTVTLSLSSIEGTALAGITIGPVNVSAGGSSTGVIALSTPAPKGGATVTLTNNTAGITVPSSVTVPVGSTTAPFNIAVAPGAAGGTAVIQASYLDASKAATLTITSNPVALSSVVIAPGSVAGGSTSTGTVTLSSAAPAGGLTVSLASSTSSAVVPASITVAGGSTVANFTVQTQSVSVSASATVTASYNGANKTATLTITPAVNAALASVSVSPVSVPAGTSATGTVTLSGPAPAGGLTIDLWTNGSPAFVPASVTVAPGASTATFSITTINVSSSTQGTITAFSNGSIKTATITVTPTVTANLSSVSVGPATVTGGSTSTGTITLSAPAPAGGLGIDLWTNGSPAFVPGSVNVPAGATTATFTVTTIGVSSSTQGTITAFYNGTMRTASITVTP
jgi:hypothetical protein